MCCGTMLKSNQQPLTRSSVEGANIVGGQSRLALRGPRIRHRTGTSTARMETLSPIVTHVANNTERKFC